jgi:hypothetical protein
MESNDNLWQEMQTQETRCDLRQGKDLGLVKYGKIHRGKVLFNDAHGRGRARETCLCWQTVNEMKTAETTPSRIVICPSTTFCTFCRDYLS